jgi:hypothetical protein
MAKKIRSGFVTTEKGRAERHNGPVRTEENAMDGTVKPPDAQAATATASPHRPDYAMVEQILERAATFGF